MVHLNHRSIGVVLDLGWSALATANISAINTINTKFRILTSEVIFASMSSLGAMRTKRDARAEAPGADIFLKNGIT